MPALYHPWLVFIASDLLNILRYHPRRHNRVNFRQWVCGLWAALSYVLSSATHSVNFVYLEIFTEFGKPLSPNFLFVLIHILPVWWPFPGRKMSCFLKLHENLLLPKVLRGCSVPVTVGLFPSWSQCVSVPPFPQSQVLGQHSSLDQGVLAISTFRIDWLLRSFSRKMKYEPLVTRLYEEYLQRGERSHLWCVSASGALCDNGRYFFVTVAKCTVHTLLSGSNFDTYGMSCGFYILTPPPDELSL